MVQFQESQMANRTVITLSGTWRKDIFKDDEMIKSLCIESGKVEFIGTRVDEKRQCYTFVKYNNKIFFLDTFCIFSSKKKVTECSAEFFDYNQEIDSTEPIEKYRYYVEYCNPKIDDEMVICWYYKEDEFEEAEKKQKELGADLAYLKKIE